MNDFNEAANEGAPNNNNEPNNQQINTTTTIIDSSSSTQSSPKKNPMPDKEESSNDPNDNSNDDHSFIDIPNANDDDNKTTNSGVYLDPNEYRSLQDMIEAMQTQIENYSDRWANALDRIEALQERNDRLHEQLTAARAAPPPAPAPDHNDLLQTLINAQNEANRIQEQAKSDEAKARQQSVTHKFPSLKTLNQRDINTWHQKVLTVIQLPKYREFYDDLASDMVASGHNNPTLNTTLYSEILTHTSAEAESYILAKTHLRGDGVALINELQETFNSKWTIVETQQKQLE